MRRAPTLLLALALAACGSSSSATDGGSASDAPAPTTGTLAGFVTRSGTPMADGIGGLYVAVFDMNPVTAMDEANVVAAQVIPSADMSSADARIAYEVTDIPPRAEPYYVIAFLDDNDTVTDPTMASPDRGDLITLEGFAPPQVTVSMVGRVAQDLDLSTNLPF